MEYPLRVLSYGLVEDRAAPAPIGVEWGCAEKLRLSHDCIFNGAGERFRHAPWGVFGGADGGRGRFLHTHPNASEEQLEIKPSGIVLKEGAKISVETPGSGGYGAPDQRSEADIETDRRSGKFSDAYLKRHYGN